MPDNNPLLLGWREWVALPDLKLSAIKAKVDTGAKTSALHAFEVEPFSESGIDKIRFKIHPIQGNQDFAIECAAPILDYREVTDSGGHKEMRYVIETMLLAGKGEWPIELTLTNRDNMRFRMLIGRRAMEDRALVDPSASYLTGKLKPKSLYGL